MGYFHDNAMKFFMAHVTAVDAMKTYGNAMKAHDNAISLLYGTKIAHEM